MFRKLQLTNRGIIDSRTTVTSISFNRNIPPKHGIAFRIKLCFTINHAGQRMRTMLCSDRQNDANGRPLERKYTVAPELPDHQFSSGVIERRGHDGTAGRHHVVMHRHSPSWRTFGILASFAFPPNPVFHDATITCIWRHAKQKHQPQHGRLRVNVMGIQIENEENAALRKQQHPCAV